MLLSVLLVLSACAAEPQDNVAQQPQENNTASVEQKQKGPATPLEETAAWILASVKEPGLGATFGEWAILGLARSGVAVPEEYFESYYKNVVEYVENCGGVLDSRKYTEYSRVILALTAIGKDPADVGGYDLVAPLADYDQTVFQGINGPTFALIALNSGAYELPVCGVEGATQATEEAYIALLLDSELENGGWSFSGGAAEVDMTAMVLQALAQYRSVDGVEQAVERGVAALAQMISAGEEETCEGMAQTIVALTELGISLEDERFVSGGLTVMERLLTYRAGDGGFMHVQGSASDQMATEQAFYALAAAYRAEHGMTSLYNMSDVG